jgi:hypothetical protein
VILNKRQKIDRAAEILARWFSSHQRKPDLHLYMIRNRWPELVGEKLASHTFPSSFKESVLTITVGNSAWLHELSFMRSNLIQQLKAVFRDLKLTQIRLISGAVPKQGSVRQFHRAEERVAYVELPPELVETIEKEVAQIPLPELREAILVARMAHARRVLRFG